MTKQIPLTQEQYNKLVERLDHIQKVLKPENIQDIQNARELGDLSENAEYDDAKEQQGKLNQEETMIKAKLENATIIQKKDRKDTIDVGHTVTLKSRENDEIKHFTLLGQWDTEPTTTSVESPMGKAMLDKKVGDEIIVDAPFGETTYTILSID
ncbi:transcription elongation factor GreA (plasmid) [Pontibacillus sp. ALD_SL1]|uniref:transcription elongation factor GreA n=1 Tax=Pontibacillus sp. ALD_SL1 TaxID=2777185 RepID=UPI001A9602F5|nr:transcription elongation factor GreA [Pontibacillus sp. ALD_SL1]QST03090.1 transcription elongation factor GreA [Pontibacillus sp. ALD_SL1]